MCQEHWGKLKDAIAARGMDKFIAPTKEEAARRMHAELHVGEAPDKIFEPLMGAFWSIVSNVLDLLTPDAKMALLTGEDTCPLCFANAAAKNDGEESDTFFDVWIENAANDSLDRAKELGLVGAS